jgi:hypothetical protein
LELEPRELEPGLLQQELGARAWSLELPKLGAWSCWSRGAVVGAGTRPTRDLGEHLYIFSRLFVLFVLYVLLCYVLVELRCSAV